MHLGHWLRPKLREHTRERLDLPCRVIVPGVSQIFPSFANLARHNWAACHHIQRDFARAACPVSQSVIKRSYERVGRDQKLLELLLRDITYHKYVRSHFAILNPLSHFPLFRPSSEQSDLK